MMESKRVLDVFMREKPTKLLIELLNNNGATYAAVIAKNIDCTYSHVIRIVQEMEGSHLVNSRKEGRTKVLELTGRGEQVARHLESIRSIL